ncbi:sugar transferase [Fodinibius sp. AD559]|uniref:sugar transferase n=1 Tax=Fodinibius sp. AD559 TaxID=3424179 RepID=UPI004046CD1C
MSHTASLQREVETSSIPISERYNSEAVDFIQSNLDTSTDEINFVETTYRFNIESLQEDKVKNLVNLKRLNDVRHINKFFETVNSEMAFGGLFIGCFESKEQRKERILNAYPFIIAQIVYVLDFIWKRVCPKIKFTQSFYFDVTNGNDRSLPLSTILGRLVSCGFEIVDYSEKNRLTYFTARKIEKPEFDDNPTYGPLIALKRVGYKGKIIDVYKLRTMHPYSEYLQEYIYEQNDVEKGGKFKDDFRITNWGKVLRKFWLDELPMLYNWFKGDLKLVGVRPLSRHYFELYPEQFQERRKKYKPGLIPPFYVDLPKTMEEIFASEKKYMMQYEKHPYLTDIKYFFKSLYNIFIKRARSN